MPRRPTPTRLFWHAHGRDPTGFRPERSTTRAAAFHAGQTPERALRGTGGSPAADQPADGAPTRRRESAGQGVTSTRRRANGRMRHHCGRPTSHRSSWRSTNPKQKPPRKTPCTDSGSLPIIAAPALLTLAQWIRKRRETTQGGETCQTRKTGVLPPAPEFDRGEPAADGPLGENAGRTTDARTPRVRTDDRAKDDRASKSEGGGS